MIDLIVNGRLGNQLFMYAMARSVQMRTGDSQLYINTSILEQEKVGNSLLSYNLSSDIQFYSGTIRTTKKGIKGTWIQNLVLMFYLKKILNKTHRETQIFEDRWKWFFEFFGVYVCKDCYRDMNFHHKKKILLYGYFQSEKYFQEYAEQIRKECMPKCAISEKNKELVQEIETSESVCVSVRLGEDFSKNDMYNVCNVTYYRAAIEFMQKTLHNPKFYFFSDKAHLLEKYFGDISNAVFEVGEDPDYEKLRVMSQCKHFIISNSSFSWWAQYLSQNAERVVIAPSHWYNGDIPCDIYQDSWILIDPQSGKEVQNTAND